MKKIWFALRFTLNLVVANGDLLPKLKKGWTFVPTKFGVPVPVNVADLANMFQGPQQITFFPENHTAFELYTLKNPKKPQIISPSNLTTVTSSNFKKNLPTRIYIHGWRESGRMKRYLNEGKFEIHFNWTILKMFNFISLPRQGKTKCKFNRCKLGKIIAYSELCCSSHLPG